MARRLDPDYYAPRHLQDEEDLQSLGALTLGSTGKLFAGPFGSELPTSVFVKDGIPLFRVGNVGAMDVDERDLARIPQDLHERLSASEVVPGDVLIVKASVGEKVCVIPEWIPKANITQHILALRPNGSVDERFIAAAIFSSYGRRQVQRRALGAIIQYLGVQEARTVLLPAIHPDAQAYVGNKVRQAEALRSIGYAIRASVNSVLNSLVDESRARTSWRTTPRDFDTYRMNPKHYDPVVLSSIRRMRDSTGVVLLGDVIGARKLAGGATPLGAVYEMEGIRFLRVQNVRPWTLDNTDAVYISPQTDAAIRRSRCEPDDIVLTITGYPGTASLVTGIDVPANINQHSVRFGVRSDWLPGYTVAAINSHFVQKQVSRLAIGGTRDALDYASVASLFLPVLDDAGMRRIDAQVRRCIGAEQAARTLIHGARLIVEAIIARRVSEADLMAAHKDAVIDRTLLQRLTTRGFDATTGDRLFPDLDRLEELLANAKAIKDA